MPKGSYQITDPAEVIRINVRVDFLVATGELLVGLLQDASLEGICDLSCAVSFDGLLQNCCVDTESVFSIFERLVHDLLGLIVTENSAVCDCEDITHLSAHKGISIVEVFLLIFTGVVFSVVLGDHVADRLASLQKTVVTLAESLKSLIASALKQIDKINGRCDHLLCAVLNFRQIRRPVFVVFFLAVSEFPIISSVIPVPELADIVSTAEAYLSPAVAAVEPLFVIITGSPLAALLILRAFCVPFMVVFGVVGMIAHFVL